MKEIRKIEFLCDSKIIHFNFRSQKSLTKTMLRFQEFYESPYFKGKYFNISEFKVWYKKETKSKKFTYYEDWVGFNFPSYIVKNFIKQGFLKDLSKDEKYIIDVLSQLNQKYYVIGTYEKSDTNNTKSFLHEMVHAMYYLNTEYRRKVNLAIKKEKDNIVDMSKTLLNLGGYSEGVLYDEINAYVSTNNYRKTDKLYNLSIKLKELKSSILK